VRELSDVQLEQLPKPAVISCGVPLCLPLPRQVLPFNMDGRQFIRLLLATPGGPADDLQQQQQQQQQQDAGPAQPAAAAVDNEQLQDQQQQQQNCASRDGDQQSKQEQQQQQKQQQLQRKRKLEAVLPLPVPPGFCPTPGGLLFHHVVMNLPASAVEFLDAFQGAFDPQAWADQLPLVHVYTFMKNESEAGGSRAG